ncbi:LysR family transcriptional regulator [Bifidobacterium psychraerophilum]|nr:LysR family transcriptional regulator [Bifidobacterium psychraerophilum]
MPKRMAETARGRESGAGVQTLNPQMLVTLWNIERHGSLSAAARASGWSQAAISQQVKRLEQQCGMALVERNAHGVSLTGAGMMLARHGELIAKRVTQAEGDLEEYRLHASSHLRILAPPSICSTLLARTLVNLSRESDIDVSLVQMEPPEAILHMDRGQADAAIIFRYGSIPDFLHISEDLQVDYFGEDPLRLLVRKSSGIAKAYERNGEAVDLALLHDESWIAGCETCQANLVSIAREWNFEPKITHSTDDYVVTQNLVEMGLGISIVPELSTLSYLRDDVVACPIDDDHAVRSVGLLTRVGDTRKSIRTLNDAIRNVASRYLRPVQPS